MLKIEGASNNMGRDCMWQMCEWFFLFDKGLLEIETSPQFVLYFEMFL